MSFKELLRQTPVPKRTAARRWSRSARITVLARYGLIFVLVLTVWLSPVHHGWWTLLISMVAAAASSSSSTTSPAPTRTVTPAAGVSGLSSDGALLEEIRNGCVHPRSS